MSLLDKLHDKALSATKKHVKYPLLIASGIADWFVGTYDEIKGHGEAAKASGEERDYKLYVEGIQGAAFGEVGAYAAAVYTGNKAVALPLAADLLVRNANALISSYKDFKRIEKDPDAERVINVDLTGAIGTARTLAYKIANRRRRSDAEPVEGGDTEETPLIFPDPLPDPIPDPISELVLHPLKGEELPDPFRDDEMGIMDKKPGLEDEVSDTSVEEPDPGILPVLPGVEIVEPEPAPMLLPGPDERYTLPDIIEEDEPRSGCCGGRGGSCGTSCRGDCGTKPAEDKPLGESAPQTPSTKAKVDIGPLSRESDDDDPLGSADEEDTGNKLF